MSIRGRVAVWNDDRATVAQFDSIRVRSSSFDPSGIGPIRVAARVAKVDSEERGMVLGEARWNMLMRTVM